MPNQVPYRWEYIAQAMTRQGISQQALAKELEVSQGAISHWLTGRNWPRRRRLRQLAAALNLPPEELQKNLPVDIASM